MPSGPAGEQYTLLITCERTSYTFTASLRQKSDAHVALLDALNRMPFKPHSCRVDGALEFTRGPFANLLRDKGIIMEISPPYLPQFNGKSERMQSTLWSMSRSMMIDASAPPLLWPYAVRLATTFMNIIGCPSPYQQVYNKPPLFGHLKRFGSLAYVMHTKPEMSKLDKFAPRAFAAAYLCPAPNMPSDTHLYYLLDSQRIVARRGARVVRAMAFVPSPSTTSPTKANSLPLLSPSEPGGATGSLPPSLPPSTPTPAPSDTSSDSDSISTTDVESLHTAPTPPASVASGGDLGDDAPDDVDEQDEQPAAELVEQQVQAPNLRRSARIQNIEHVARQKEYTDNERTDTWNQIVLELAQANQDATHADIEAEMLSRLDQTHNNLPAHQPHHQQQGDLPQSLMAAVQTFGTDALTQDDHGLTPRTFREAVNDPVHGAAWRQAADKEYNSMLVKAFTPVNASEVPKGATVMDTVWIFKRKHDGRYKGRLAARGFRQSNPGDTYSPVGRLSTLRLMLTKAVLDNLKVFTFDVTEAFLSSNLLGEDIYIRPVEGYPSPGQLFKLRKSIYGIKNASLAFYLSITDKLRKMGAVEAPSDPCLFKFREAWVLLYIDDLLLISAEADAKAFAALLAERFEIRGTDGDQTYLGHQLVVNKDGSITLDQTEYAKNIARFVGVEHALPLKSPMSDQLLPATDGEKPFDNTRYRQAVGMINYLCTSSRPDVAFAAKELSRHSHAPTSRHWAAVRNVAKYLLGTTFTLTYRPLTQAPRIFVAYADASWGECPATRKSTSGFMIYFAGMPIAWKSRTQRTIAQSSCEAEVISMVDTFNELRALQQQADFLELTDNTLLPPTPQDEYHRKTGPPGVLYCDNQASLFIAKSKSSNDRTKYLDLRVKVLLEQLRLTNYVLRHLGTEEMIADCLTKPLPGSKHQAAVKRLHTPRYEYITQ